MAGRTLAFTFLGEDKNLGKTMKGLGKETGKLHASWGKLAGAFAGAAVGVKAVSFMKDAISQASDLNEAGTKLTAVFGTATKDVEKFAAAGAKALGQSKLDVLNAAATFGIFGKAAGLTGKPLAEFSNGFVKLSTDIASFYNTSPEAAVEAIGSALRGEAEPMRQFGVMLDEASLNAAALAAGIVKPIRATADLTAAQVKLRVAEEKLTKARKERGRKSTEALVAQQAVAKATEDIAKAAKGSIPKLNAQQKVLAAQAVIYKQTRDAQGDFTRTSGGLANQQRILQAQLADTKGEIGRGLLPIVVKLATFANDRLVPAINGFIGGMQKGTGPGGQFAATLQDMADAGKATWDNVGPVFRYMGDHPDLMKQIAKDALILAGAFKAIALTKAAGAIMGVARTGPALAATRAAATGGARVPVRGATAAAAGRTAGGLAVGGLIGTQMDLKDARSAGVGLATAAAAGFMIAGPWGAAGAAGAALVVSAFGQRGRDEVKRSKELKAFREALAAAMTLDPNDPGSAFTQSARATSVIASQYGSLAEVERKLADAKKKFDNSLVWAEDKNKLREYLGIPELEAARRAYDKTRVDSLQFDATVKSLHDFGMQRRRESIQALRLEGRAERDTADSVEHLTQRFGAQIDKSRHASDSLRVQEGRLRALKTPAADAKGSLRALEIQMDRLKPPAVGAKDSLRALEIQMDRMRSLSLTIDVLQRFRTSGQPGSTDPEVRSSIARLTATSAPVLSTATMWKPLPVGATGGIVRRPTLSLLGEAGAEAVIPLDKTPGNSPLGRFGGGMNVVINIEGLVTPDRVVEDVRAKLAKKFRNGGNLGFA